MAATNSSSPVVWIVAGLAASCHNLTCGLGALAAIPYLLILKIVIYLSVTGQPTMADRYAGAASPVKPQDTSPFPRQPGDSPFMS